MDQLVSVIAVDENPISAREIGSSSRRTTNCGTPAVTLFNRTSQPSVSPGTSTRKNCHLPAGTAARIALPPSSANGTAVSSRVTKLNGPSATVGL